MTSSEMKPHERYFFVRHLLRALLGGDVGNLLHIECRGNVGLRHIDQNDWDCTSQESSEISERETILEESNRFCTALMTYSEFSLSNES